MNDANEKAAATYQDMLLKHGKIKQCKPVDQEGCGEFKKISEFRYTYRDKAMESVNIGIHGVQSVLKKEGKPVMITKKHMENRE